MTGPPSPPWLLGIEIGGTKLQVGLGRRDGSLLDLERRRVEPARGAEAIRAQIQAAVGELLRRVGVETTDLAAVGVGFGGPVDPDRGVAIVSNQIEGWVDYPLAGWVRETLGVREVAIENDAATAALGEARRGAGAGYDPVLYVTIGSGVGGGLIVGGRIYRGSGRGAVEIGHLLVEDRGRTNSTGELTLTTLEQAASGWAIGRAGRDLITGSTPGAEPTGPLVHLCTGQANRVTAELVAEAARRGDVQAEQILHHARTALAQALAHAITLLAPGRVILGGGVSLIGEELWFDPIRHEVDRRVFPPFRGSYEIVPARLGEEVVVHGALALAADRLQPGSPTIPPGAGTANAPAC